MSKFKKNLNVDQMEIDPIEMVIREHEAFHSFTVKDWTSSFARFAQSRDPTAEARIVDWTGVACFGMRMEGTAKEEDLILSCCGGRSCGMN